MRKKISVPVSPWLDAGASASASGAAVVSAGTRRSSCRKGSWSRCRREECSARGVESYESSADLRPEELGAERRDLRDRSPGVGIAYLGDLVVEVGHVRGVGDQPLARGEQAFGLKRFQTYLQFDCGHPDLLESRSPSWASRPWSSGARKKWSRSSATRPGLIATAAARAGSAVRARRPAGDLASGWGERIPATAERRDALASVSPAFSSPA